MGIESLIEQDSFRLPDGICRVAYDADTQVYTFRDRKGGLYYGPPGEAYGVLTPIYHSLEKERPNAFASDNDDEPPQTRAGSSSGPASFHDFLPSNLITSPTSSEYPKSDTIRPAGKALFVSAVRKSAMPKMQGVVAGLKRSMTSVRRSSPSRHTTGEDTANLLHRDSQATSRHRHTASGDSTLSNSKTKNVNVDGRSSPRRRF